MSMAKCTIFIAPKCVAYRRIAPKCATRRRIVPKRIARRRILIAGTGDMIAKCANWGVPAPEWYEDDPDDFRVVLKRPVSEIGEEKTEQKSRVKSRVKSSVKSRGVNLRKRPNDGSEIAQGRDGRGVKSRVKTGVKTRVKSRVKIMSSAERIIAYLMANPEASAHELSIVVNLSVKGVEKNLRVLKESNRLRRVGPDKGGHWEVIG